MKKCSKCKLHKELTEFNKLSARPDGYDSQCALCVRTRNQAYYLRNAESERSRTRISQAKRRKERQQKGLCYSCSVPVIGRTNYCIQHWARRLSTSRTYSSIQQDTTRVKTLATELIPLIKSITVCPYTGEPLIPGINVDLDHKIPLSRRLDLLTDITNLQFVSHIYNQAKQTMTDEEFGRHYKITYIP